MPVTSADVALGVFTVCNTVRVLAYLPQIVKISRDTQGATAISYATWALFGASHLSTVAYAVLVMMDWRMAAIFAANALCCLVILGLTAWKRALFHASQKTPDPTRTSTNSATPIDGSVGSTAGAVTIGIGPAGTLAGRAS